MEFNKRAQACYKKCGFKEYGRRRKCRFINGKYYDVIEMDILSEEFKENCIKNKEINQIKNKIFSKIDEVFIRVKLVNKKFKSNKKI